MEQNNQISGWHAFWILAAALSVGIAITVCTCQDTPEARAAAVRAEAAAKTPTPSIQIGQMTCLIGRQPLVAASQGFCGEVSLLRRAGDSVGLQRMIDTDQALLEKEGTKVLVLDIDQLNELTRVRLMSGPDAGQDGWLPTWYVQP